VNGPATPERAQVRGGVRGVIFDLDGVIVDTEHLWGEAWATCSRGHGAEWGHDDSTAVMGMSAPEWSAYVAEHIGDGASAESVYAECVGLVVDAVRSGRGPLLPGARALISDTAARVPIALASSAAREVIDTVLEHEDIGTLFAATVSSEEVARGKPSPDVYAEAARRLGPEVEAQGLAVEDSGNGIKAAKAAGLMVVAIPNPQFPPKQDALDLADLVAGDHGQARDYVLSQLVADLDPNGHDTMEGAP
jgi:HAD superfamily hydrolase (TIGR01509 family)